jgi:hypothetical protein
MSLESSGLPALSGERVVAMQFDADCRCWTISTSSGAWIGIYSPWQIRDAGAVRLASGDHAQPYGVGTPVDAAARARELLAARSIVGTEVDPVSGDLTVRFEDGYLLRSFTDATGYEAWHAGTPEGAEWIAQGSGRIVHFGPKSKEP